MDKVQKNLNDLERKLGKSNKIVAKGSDIKLQDAMKLGRKSNAMVGSIRKGIKEYDGSDPTPEESKKILEQMKGIVDLTETQLDLLVQNKGQFDKLHVAGLVKRNLIKTEEASTDLEKIMMEKAPADLKIEAEALAKRRKVAFDKATGVYSGATGGEEHADEEDDSD